MTNSIGIVWFNNYDLRIHDNEALLEATSNNKYVLPVFCFDKRWFGNDKFTKKPRMSIKRMQFLVESVNDLKANLQRHSSDLLVLPTVTTTTTTTTTTIHNPSTEEKIINNKTDKNNDGDDATSTNFLSTALPEVLLPQIIQQCSATNIYYHDHYCTEELELISNVENAIEELNANEADANKKVKLHKYWRQTLYHIDDLPFLDNNNNNNESNLRDISRLPTTFTAFRTKIEKGNRKNKPTTTTVNNNSSDTTCSSSSTIVRDMAMAVPSPTIATAHHTLPKLPLRGLINGLDGMEFNGIDERLLAFTPSVALLLPSNTALNRSQFKLNNENRRQYDDRSVLKFVGGETAGLKRVEEFIFNSDSLKSYKVTRNGLIGANYSSKFSAWLALGCISPKLIYQQVKQYEKVRVKNDSTYWLIFELLWRDYLAFYALKFGNRIFLLNGTKQQSLNNNSSVTWKIDNNKLEAWKNGLTGIPFVDANMRELLASGFMSNRGRQVVASFLTKDLEIDWRFGAAHFESHLIDHDPASNYGNWNYIAGVGCDPRENRYFNVIKQASNYDPNGEYCKLWLPELKNLPVEFLIDPYKLTLRQRNKLGVATSYPRPICNLKCRTTKPRNNNNPNNNNNNNNSKRNNKRRKYATKHGGVPGIDSYFKAT